jgi:hypothetical protein
MIAEGRKMRFSGLLSALSVAIALALASPSSAAPNDDGPVYGPELQGFEYPSPVLHFRFSSQGQALDMAYMDVQPEKPNGRAVALMHGKNFCAATWQGTIAVMSQAGYLVIAPSPRHARASLTGRKRHFDLVANLPQPGLRLVTKKRNLADGVVRAVLGCLQLESVHLHASLHFSRQQCLLFAKLASDGVLARGKRFFLVGHTATERNHQQRRCGESLCISPIHIAFPHTDGATSSSAMNRGEKITRSFPWNIVRLDQRHRTVPR